MLRQSEIEHWKDWRLRKRLRETRKARDYNAEHGGGLSRLMAQSLDEEIPMLEREIERRKPRKE